MYIYIEIYIYRDIYIRPAVMVIVTIGITLLDYTVHVSVSVELQGAQFLLRPPSGRRQGTVETNHEIHQ